MPTQNALIAVASIFVVAAIVAGGIALTHHSKTEQDSPPPIQAGLSMLLGSVEPVQDLSEKTLSQSNASVQRNLQQALDKLGAVETAHKIHQHMNEFRSRLSSSYTYVETCVSALRRSNNAAEYRDELQVSLGSVKERLSDVLDRFPYADPRIESRPLLREP